MPARSTLESGTRTGSSRIPKARISRRCAGSGTRSQSESVHCSPSSFGARRALARPDLGRRAIAEGFAAFALVFAGAGAIVANAEYRGALGTVGVALVFGLVIMVMVYATGHLSGAHINPAVTIAFTLTRHFPRREAAAYVAAQCLGAMAGALVLLAAWTDKPAALGATVPSVGAGTALVYEILLTAF